jgi:hypothetical protein
MLLPALRALGCASVDPGAAVVVLTVSGLCRGLDAQFVVRVDVRGSRADGATAPVTVDGAICGSSPCPGSDRHSVPADAEPDARGSPDLSAP